MCAKKKTKGDMQKREHLFNFNNDDDDFERPPSLAYPLVVGAFACIAVILVACIAYLDPFLALIACGFVFFVVLVTANVRFYRRRKVALRRIARRVAAGRRTVHHQASRTMSGGNTSEYLASTELHLPQSPKPVIGGNKRDLRESGPYSVIDDILPSKDPSKHMYMNYRKEAESDPEKDKLYIDPRRSLMPKMSLEVAVSNATTVSGVTSHDDVPARDEGTTEDGTAHKADRQSDVKLYDDTTGTK